jgi:hypothetical protein
MSAWRVKLVGLPAIGALSICLAGAAGPATGLPEASSSGATVVCPADAPALVRFAAKEIRRYVYLRTGHLAPLTESGPGIALKIDSSLDPESYRIGTAGDTTAISGGDELGVLYGAYRYAELLGMRFYLHGDVVPDDRLKELPAVSDTGKPEFALRGILPFHDFPEGPDLWEADDYKAGLAQLVKLRMNFIGLHTYTECGWGSEPTVWLGLPEDVDEQGRPRFSYAAHYFSTARNASGHAPRKVSEMLFGGSLLFESDPWGPSVMRGVMPQGETLAEKNAVFVRAGELLKDAFTYARRFGVKTCVGTEIPLTHPERLLPHELKARLKAKGLSVTDPATRRALYRGTFLRAARAYPLDYYWLWTPESWRGPQPDAVVQASQDDLLAAVAAAREAGAPFTLATAGWTLGPSKDRTLFDRVLPKEMPFSCINLELGTVPVDAGFAQLQGRPGWAIPWLEDDLSMSSPQLWVGRILRDAYDARRFGCQGLMGIHWRTAEVGPMIAALAQSQWRVPQPGDTRPPPAAIGVDGGAVASFDAPVDGTELDPIYQTVRYDVNAYDLALPNGRYRVTLQFNEPFYHAAGKRVFGVAIQGRTVVERLDIFERVGRNKALDLSFADIAVADGHLRVRFLKDLSSQLIGADKAEAQGKYVEFPCIAGLVVEGQANTLKLNCGGPAWDDYVADPGPVGTPRYLPADDFYLDWAQHQFGPEAALEIAAIFARIDGHLPAPAPHCPGGIAVNSAPWSSARKQYAFVDELASLRPRIRGAGSQARFDRWVRSFAYLRAIGRVSCAGGALDRAMGELAKAPDPAARQALGQRSALPARVELQDAWREMVTLCLETADTWGSIGQVLTHEMYNRGQMGLLERHDAALAAALGGELPAELEPDPAYHGIARLIVPTLRSVAVQGETLALKIIALDRQPAKSVSVKLRPLGGSRWQTLPAAHLARAVWQATLPAATEDFEYYIEAEGAAAQGLRWPVTAPQVGQTVVVLP